MNQARNAGNQCFNEALCACVSCLRCCGCYLSDYLERFFWTCKNRCGENGNKNQVDVWFPIVFEAVLPFFGAMLGTTVLYQFQCVNYVTAEQDPTEYWIRFYSGWVGWILGFPILSFFFSWSVLKFIRCFVYKDHELAPITGMFFENNFHRLLQAPHRVAHFDSLPPTSWGKIRSENPQGFFRRIRATQRGEDSRDGTRFF